MKNTVSTSCWNLGNQNDIPHYFCYCFFLLLSSWIFQIYRVKPILGLTSFWDFDFPYISATCFLWLKTSRNGSNFENKGWKNFLKATKDSAIFPGMIFHSIEHHWKLEILSLFQTPIGIYLIFLVAGVLICRGAEGGLLRDWCSLFDWWKRFWVE